MQLSCIVRHACWINGEILCALQLVSGFSLFGVGADNRRPAFVYHPCCCWCSWTETTCSELMPTNSSKLLCVFCFSAGFLPSYLLPAYEEVVDLPVMPPPPYASLHPAPPPTDQREESPCLPSAVSVHINDDSPISAGPHFAHGHIQSSHNPNKELTPGRYRRFTGDSGIEVCDGQELLDQHRFLELEEGTQEEEMDPYNHCDSQSFEESNADNAVVDNTTAADSESLKWRPNICRPNKYEMLLAQRVQTLCATARA